MSVKTFPLQLQLIHNTGIRVLHHSWSLIEPGNLTMTTNAGGGDVRYLIVKIPQHGFVEVADSAGQWWISSTFNQSQLDTGRVRYRHSKAGRPTADMLKFKVTRFLTRLGLRHVEDVHQKHLVRAKGKRRNHESVARSHTNYWEDPVPPTSHPNSSKKAISPTLQRKEEKSLRSTAKRSMVFDRTRLESEFCRVLQSFVEFSSPQASDWSDCLEFADNGSQWRNAPPPRRPPFFLSTGPKPTPCPPLD